MKFSRCKLNRLHRDNDFGISWFKPIAKIHLSKAFELTALLDQQGYPITVLKSARPGYVVYEDDTQIVAEPFSDTVI